MLVQVNTTREKKRVVGKTSEGKKNIHFYKRKNSIQSQYTITAYMEKKMYIPSGIVVK
jgi:hypothetical protein